MGNVLAQFLRILAVPLLIVLGLYYTLLSLATIPFPLNYTSASLPFWISLTLWLKEMHRKQQLGFAHDRPREIPEEQMQQALEEIEKERKKHKPLP